MPLSAFGFACARVAVLAAVLLPLAAFGTPQKTRYTTVELISEHASVPVFGGTITVGLYLEPNPSWHAYWSNPGDAGKAPRITWSLPPGFDAGELSFPSPVLLPFGDLITYGYDEPILLLAEITVPEGLVAGETVELGGNARWMVCDDSICVPDRANVSVQLAVGDGGLNPDHTERFDEARRLLPNPGAWPASFTIADGVVSFDIAPADIRHGFDDAYLFVASPNLVDYRRQTAELSDSGLRFVMDAAAADGLDDATSAVLTYTRSDGRAASVALDFLQRPAATLSAALATRPESGMGLLRAMVFALIGGVILNLMPCVFPVLSMKALSLVRLGDNDRRAARESGVMYTLGILVAFAAVAAVLLSLRAAGEAAGWGFQMQNPLIVVGLGLLMVAVAVNLLGAFEVGTRIMGVGQGLVVGDERRAAFFTGLLAVLVATPCMAPFMAAALGYALTQPAAVAVAVFLALGVGLALPYLLLSFVPTLGRVMPKPGQWMQTFRHLLAFPLLITALWLFWIVGQQLGATSMFIGLLAATALAFSLWAYGGSQRAARKAGWYASMAAGAVACFLAVSSVEANRTSPAVAGDRSAGTLGGLALERFDPASVEAYIAAGQPAFVYFTADWCISCKANERVALSTDQVAAAFNDRNIRVIEGDWTREDPEITRWLEMYGRAGVPLYLYFPTNSSLETVTILPQILTPGIVVDAIVSADAAAQAEST